MQGQGSERVQGTVLEPCTLGAVVTMQPGGAGNCEVTVSDLRLNLSADLLELAQSLQQTVLAPLVAPAPDRCWPRRPNACPGVVTAAYGCLLPLPSMPLSSSNSLRFRPAWGSDLFWGL